MLVELAGFRRCAEDQTRVGEVGVLFCTVHQPLTQSSAAVLRVYEQVAHPRYECPVCYCTDETDLLLLVKQAEGKGIAKSLLYFLPPYAFTP